MPTEVHTQVKEGKKAAADQEELLQSLGSALDVKFREYSSARNNKEEEWTTAIRQYEGLWDEDDLTKAEKAFKVNDKGQLPPPVNITRPKTNIAISKMQDAQFPVGGDFNFTMLPEPPAARILEALQQTEPTPSAQFQAVAQGMDPSQAPSPADYATQQIDMLHEAARGMQLRIQEDLRRTKYGRKARMSIKDLAILGTAVIKGPVLSPTVRKLYQPELTATGDTIQVLGSVSEERPEVFRVDPRLFYPDPSARTPEEISDSFELHLLSKKELVLLAGSSAFMPEQIAKVLEAGANHDDIPSSITDVNWSLNTMSTKNRFVVKEYHGCLDKEILFNGGYITEEDKDDPLKEFFGEVWLCNKQVIRLSLSYLEGIDSIPYGVACWEDDPASVLGHGVPFLLRYPQRVVNNAYMLLLDNASLTSGPQIVINKEMIEPADPEGTYDIEAMKVWFMTEYGADVREAMQFVDIPAQVPQIMQIVDMAMQFADMESSTPQIAQGEMPVGNNTLTGLSKVFSAHNVNQKRASMNWDDNITIPLVERMYHHEMQYGGDLGIQEPMSVVIGGATERIDAEMRAQELERVIGLAGSNPEFQLQIEPAKAFRQLVTLTRAGDILRTQEEVDEALAQQQAQAQEQGQQDPAMLVAQAKMAEAQNAAQKAQAEAQLAQAKMQLEQQRMQLEAQKMQAELQLRQMEMQARSQEAWAKLQQADADREVALMKMAGDREMSMEELRAKLGMAEREAQMKEMKLWSDREMFDREIQVKLETGKGI
jgi:hypothetical protein